MKDALVVLAVGVAGMKLTHDVTLYFGIPVSLNTLVACGIGSFCSFSFGDRIEPRSRMFGLFLSGVLMGAALTSIANAIIAGFTTLQMTGALQAGIGTVVSFLARWFLPWLIEVVSKAKWLSWLPFIRKSEDKEP